MIEEEVRKDRENNKDYIITIKMKNRTYGEISKDRQNNKEETNKKRERSDSENEKRRLKTITKKKS